MNFTSPPNKIAKSFLDGNEEIFVKASSDGEFRKALLKTVFDMKAHIRVRIRTIKGRKTKVRAVRIFKTNKKILEEIQKLLQQEGIKSNIHKAGIGFCLEIEGKTRLELFKRKIGFTDKSKKEKLNHALMAISCEAPCEVHDSP